MTTDLPSSLSATPSQPWRRYLLPAYLILTQLLTLASLILWALIWGLSSMAYDQGPSPEADRIFYGVMAYPLFPILCIALTWILYALKQRKAAAVVTTLPLIPPLLLIGMLIVSNLWWFLTQ